MQVCYTNSYIKVYGPLVRKWSSKLKIGSFLRSHHKSLAMSKGFYWTRRVSTQGRRLQLRSVDFENRDIALCSSPCHTPKSRSYHLIRWTFFSFLDVVENEPRSKICFLQKVWNRSFFRLFCPVLPKKWFSGQLSGHAILAGPNRLCMRN